MPLFISIVGAMVGGLIFGFAGRYYALKKGKKESLGVIVGVSALAGGILGGNIAEYLSF